MARLVWLTALVLPALGKKMNFVFVFPDTLRAESFSSYGNPLQTTPNLDEFAKSGVRFEQTHVMHTQCSPSRVTMLTGRHMHVLGHRTQSHLIQSYEFNYFRTLKESGYHIQYYGKNDAWSPDSFNLSVSEWHHDIGLSTGSSAYNYPESGYYSMLHTGGEVEKNDTQHNGDYRAVSKATEWMKNSPPQPFLLFFAGIGAHPPYGSPREFNDKWPVEMVKQNIELRPPYTKNKPKYHSESKGIPHYRNLTQLSDDVFYRIQASYLGMISYTDWIFGQLLKGIQEAGLEENTAIFFSSDHGDFGGDYHMVEKWPGGADDILTHVPFFARIPGGAKGFVSKAPVSLMDIPHTICQLAGINVTSNGEYGINFAESLVPQLHGTEGDLSRFVFAEGGFSPSDVFPLGSDHVPNDPKGLYYPRALEEMSEGGTGSPRWIMMRNLTHKFVYRSTGDSELYDYTVDPRELTNCIEEKGYQELRSDMQSSLLRWLVETSDVTPKHTDPRGTPKYPHPASVCALSGVDGPTYAMEEQEARLV